MTSLVQRPGDRAIGRVIGLSVHELASARTASSGITAYLNLKNGGTLEKAASMANHASTRTTQLYDWRSDEVTLDEVERAGI